MNDDEQIELYPSKIARLYDPKKIAEELCSVQPMPSNLIADLYKEAKSTEELKAEGYEPVSRLGLLWVKKDGT